MFRSMSNDKREEILTNSFFKKKYSSFENQILDEYNDKNFKIENDIVLILRIFFKLILYFIKLPFYIVLAFIGFFSKNKNTYLKDIFFEPFIISKDIFIWFFQAKYTCIILISMWFCFFIQSAFLNEKVLLSLISHPDNLLSINIFNNFFSLFFHNGLTHIISNSIALIIFGRAVERTLKSKILIIFLIGGFISNTISNIIQLYIGDIYFSLGSSSGIASIIITAILIEPFFLVLSIPLFLIGYFLIFLDFLGLTNPTQKNNLVHICGYLSIFILTIFYNKEEKDKIKKGIFINIILFSIIIGLIFFFDLKSLLEDFIYTNIY